MISGYDQYISAFAVRLLLNRKDELLSPSPEDTLRSLGVTSGDLIYYYSRSLYFCCISSGHQTLVPNSKTFFLKNILMEKSGDTSELTRLAISVHEVMLESGFVLFNPVSDKFNFSKELLSVSLRYTLPELITSTDTNTIEYVTVRFQSLGYMVVVYGSLSGSSPRRVPLDKRGFVPVIDTLKSDKEGSSSIYQEVFIFWRMVKYGLAIPLLIGLSDKAPPCLMRLPTELKLKILELLPGASVAKMACLCTELRSLALEDDLWKQKLLKEAKNFVVITQFGVFVSWKAKFAVFWRKHQRERLRRIRWEQIFSTRWNHGGNN